MDTPVRKYQKQKDYQRHKLFRKMKRRRKAAIEQAKDAPMKPLRRKFKIPKFEGGKDENKELPYPLRSSKDYDDNLAYQSGIIRDPKTGHMWSTTQEEYPDERTYLKKPNHPTFNKALWGDLISGYDVYFKNGNTYSAPTFSELMYVKPPFKFKMPKFEDGKDESTQKMKIPVTTGGAGYIPDNYGQGAIDYIRKKLYDNILPWGYNDIPQRIYNAVVKNKKEEDETRDKAIRDDLFATYLQIPKNARHNIEGGKATLTDAIYKPKGAVKGKPTYRFSKLTSPAEYGILAYAGQVPGGLNIEGEDYLPIGKNRVIYPNDINAFSELEGLGQFTVGRGYDNKGEYISYYDSWDLGDTNNPYKDESLGIGRPFNMYDRIYLDDYYGVKQPTHATYLPEVTVYGKKKKGSTFNKGKDSGIHINPKNRGKFNALKKRTGKTTEQLTHSKNPLTRKRAIFAQNAKKWKH